MAPEVIELEAEVRAAGLSMSRVLTGAGVELSTWWRWKNKDANPNVETLRRIRAELRKLA